MLMMMIDPLLAVHKINKETPSFLASCITPFRLAALPGPVAHPDPK